LSKVYKASDIDMGSAFNLLHTITSPAPIPENVQESKVEVSISGSEYFRSQAMEIIEQAKVDSYRMVAEAEATARGIITSALAEAEAELANARQTGYGEGLKQGQAAAADQNSGLISELQTLLSNISAQQREMLEQFEKEMYFLSLDIARKIIRLELDQDQKSFLSLFAGAVKGMADVESIKLVVGEKEYALASRHGDQLLAMVNGAKNIDIVLSRTAPPGTCIVETPRGIIDASVETQLQKVAEMMEETRLSGDHV